jgi:MFS family permease
MSVSAPLRWRELMAEGRGPLTLGIVLIELVTAVQSLVVTAIMPAVRHDLGGVQFYGLVFSGYTLAGLAAAPIAGRLADRRGPAQPFALAVLTFAAGTILAGFALSMPMLAITRILQGFGGGSVYTIAYGAVAKIYPEAGRARVMALLAAAWVLPGLLGPSFGAILASTIGWRWAFFSLLPLVAIATLLALPGLRGVAPNPTAPAPLAVRWPLQLALGVGLVLAAGSTPSWLSLAAITLGLAVAWPALARILPAGTFRAKAGLPAAVAAMFCIVIAFVGADYFVPLLLTGVRHRSLTEAGLVITLGTVSWSAGSWWQSRNVQRFSLARLARTGATLVVVGVLGLMGVLAGAPIWLSYVSWTLAGFGMGIAYNSVLMSVMAAAQPGGEATAVSSSQVGERLALALGGGLGGMGIALALAIQAPLGAGLAGALAIALAGGVAALAVTGRLPASLGLPPSPAVPER